MWLKGMLPKGKWGWAIAAILFGMQMGSYMAEKSKLSECNEITSLVNSSSNFKKPWWETLPPPSCNVEDRR